MALSSASSHSQNEPFFWFLGTPRRPHRSGGGTGLDLGSVTIQGDLGRILAGDAVTADTALKSLSVQSLGRLGTTSGAVSTESSLAGSAGKIQVAIWSAPPSPPARFLPAAPWIR